MEKLLQIMAALRDPETGCPWDKKQTFETIVPYTLEEAYEVADAIEQGDMDELKSELGDLLFQVVFYAQMASEQGDFDFADVVEAVSEKLTRRHPHVFAGESYEDEGRLVDAWEQSKAAERDKLASAEQASVLGGVARALPALKRAQKLQKRAARVGFDWPEVAPVIAKIEEEISELKQAMLQKNQAAITEESGDVLFSCVNLLRHLNVDAEEALRAGNQKFESRFNYIETTLNQKNRKFDSCSLDELEMLWQEAKTRLHK